MHGRGNYYNEFDPNAAEVIRAFLDTEYPTHTPKDHNG